VYPPLGIFQNFSPIRITAFAAFAVLQSACGSRLQRYPLRLATAAKSTIANFRFVLQNDKKIDCNGKKTIYWVREYLCHSIEGDFIMDTDND
jgi:hypothetical protein